MHKSTGIFHFISDGQSSKSVAEKQRKLFKKGLAHVCLFFVGRKVCSPLHLSNNRWACTWHHNWTKQLLTPGIDLTPASKVIIFDPLPTEKGALSLTRVLRHSQQKPVSVYHLVTTSNSADFQTQEERLFRQFMPSYITAAKLLEIAPPPQILEPLFLRQATLQDIGLKELNSSPLLSWLQEHTPIPPTWCNTKKEEKKKRKKKKIFLYFIEGIHLTPEGTLLLLRVLLFQVLDILVYQDGPGAWRMKKRPINKIETSNRKVGGVNKKSAHHRRRS